PRGSRWYGSTVSRIIRNPSYLGTYMAYKVDYHQGFRRQRPPEEQFALPIAALVDAEVFAAAACTLERGRRHGRPRRAQRLAAGHAVCAACGRKLAAAYARSGAAYYRCPGGGSASAASAGGLLAPAPASGLAVPAALASAATMPLPVIMPVAPDTALSVAPPASGLTFASTPLSPSTAAPLAHCTARRYWNAEAVDTLLWERVKVTVVRTLVYWLGSEKLPLAGAALASPCTNRAAQPEVIRLGARRGKLEERRAKLLDLYLSEGIERQSYDRKLEELLAEEARLNEQLAQLLELEQANENRGEWLTILSTMSQSERDDFLLKVDQMLETATFSLKQRLVECMVERIHFHDELKITISYCVTRADSTDCNKLQLTATDG
ncbi:MAG: recombinase family protein, partial [Gorillibacterium sp.]|nr:recombinase family protein [Gorillibacterium sp.]